MRAAVPLLSLLLIVPACNVVVLDAAPQAPPKQDCSAPEFRQFARWPSSVRRIMLTAGLLPRLAPTWIYMLRKC